MQESRLLGLWQMPQGYWGGAAAGSITSTTTCAWCTGTCEADWLSVLRGLGGRGKAQVAHGGASNGPVCLCTGLAGPALHTFTAVQHLALSTQPHLAISMPHGNLSTRH
jgi:hypothetical protein